MALNDVTPSPGGPAVTGPMDFNAPAAPDPNAVQYDADGYPLPTAAQIAAYRASYNDPKVANKPTAGANAYDPSLPLPKPQSENPYPISNPHGHGQWADQQRQLQANQDAKKAWQQQHETQKKAAPAAAAPAPFQSSGMDLTKQGKGESYIDSILQHYQDSGVPQVGNQSQQTLDAYRAAGPSGESQKTLDEFRNSQPADMSPYYDYASKLSSAKIDNAMASRGSYGSSNAIGQLGAAEVALRAQQARDNASYGLSRFAQEGNLAGAADAQRNTYYGQEANLAGAADTQGNTQNGIQYQWTKGLADLANTDQTAGQDRNQQLWNNNFQLAAAKAGVYGAGVNGAISDVGAATDAAENAKQGVATDTLSNANANANASNSATAGLLNAAASGASNYLKYNSGSN